MGFASVTQNFFEPFNHLPRLIDYDPCERLQFLAGNRIKIIFLLFDVGDQRRIF